MISAMNARMGVAALRARGAAPSGWGLGRLADTAMSTQPYSHLAPTMLPDMARGPARSKLAIGGLSVNGLLLFLTSFLVAASGFTRFRPEVMGLSLHPYLIPVALAFPFVMVMRLQEFPVRVLAALAVFSGMYFFSVFNGGDVLVSEIFKVATGVVTTIVCALLVRRRGDFVAGALGLSIAVAILAIRGLQEEAAGGGVGDVMEGANKNSYSMFALPAILMAGYIALNLKTVPLVFKTILVGATLPTLVVIFMGGNRSGYLGAAFVGLMLFWDRRGKGLLLVAIMTAAVAFWIVKFGSTVVLDERIRQTVKGNSSDELRWEILDTCWQIGLENPVIGVSPQVLPWEISRRVKMAHHGNVLDSHNVYGHIFASSGMICFAAMIAVGWTMWNWRPRVGGKIGGKEDPLRDARTLLRMMVALWVLRGFFSREILYNPSFSIGLGLAIGLCMLAEVARRQTAVTTPKPPNRLPPNVAVPRGAT